MPERGGPFTDREIRDRQARLRDSLVAVSLDGVLLTSFPAIYHASGALIHQFGRPAAALVTTVGEPALVCSVIEVEHVRAQSPIDDVRTYHDISVTGRLDAPLMPPTASLVELEAGLLAGRHLGGARIGFEDASLPVRMLDRLHAALPGVCWVPASDIVDRQRLVKTDAELALIRTADAIADTGLEAMLGVLGAGVLACDVHEAGRAAMLAATLALEPAAPFHLRADTGMGAAEWSAGHSETITWDASSRGRDGQLLVLITDCILWGYTGNVERTVVIGEPSERVGRDYDTMIRANEAAIEAVRPGVALAEVDRICKRVLGEAGHGTRSGSGVGRGAISYEGGWRELLMDVRAYSDVALAPGMAFSLEPDLLTADGTYRHCTTVIVTADGCEVDSRLPRDRISVA